MVEAGVMDKAGMRDVVDKMDVAEMTDTIPEAEVRVPSDWAHNVADPSIMGLVDPAIANSLITPAPEISAPLAEAETLASNQPTGSDIANFVPTEHSSTNDIVTEVNHEETVHLLKR